MNIWGPGILLVEKARQPCWIAGTAFLCLFFVTVFSFVWDDNTIPFYVLSCEPSPYRVTQAAPCGDLPLTVQERRFEEKNIIIYPVEGQYPQATTIFKMCPTFKISIGCSAGHTRAPVGVHLKQTVAQINGVDLKQDMGAASEWLPAFLRSG